MVGPGSEIGSQTTVSYSVIGRNCRIGANVHLQNVYVWDNVTIEDNCVLNTAILCDGAVVKRGSTVQPGCILSYDVSTR